MTRYLILLICFLTVTASAAAQTDCAGLTRLQTGIQARVVPGGLPNNLREEATTASAVIGQITPGAVFSVMSGPSCGEGYWWWQVNYAGKTGWTAEGDATTYWLEPYIVPAQSSDADTQGCLRPPDDYTRVQIGSATLNTRTISMLDYAQALYQAQGGTLNFYHTLTQGSYTGGIEAASFGTHDGGGALDLSVRSPSDRRVMTEAIPLMLHALRTAGFAAWLREEGELYPDSPIHIHAVAIGDAELSETARAQIDGPSGYLRGYDGLSHDDGLPRPDRSGDLVLCDWMIEMGFSDLR